MNDCRSPWKQLAVLTEYTPNPILILVHTQRVFEFGRTVCRLKCWLFKVQAAFTNPARAPPRPIAGMLQKAVRKATCEKLSGAGRSLLNARNNAVQGDSERWWEGKAPTRQRGQGADRRGRRAAKPARAGIAPERWRGPGRRRRRLHLPLFLLSLHIFPAFLLLCSGLRCDALARAHAK